jgi:hypothetical protein
MRTEEAAWGPESARGGPPEEEGKDPGLSWIQEEVGCCLQEGVLPCESGMAKKETLQRTGTQENCGSRKKFSPTGIRINHRAKVAWRKRNVFRIFQIQSRCGPRNGLGTGKRLTHRVEVTRRKNTVSRDK